MADVDPRLVQAIAAQVMAALAGGLRPGGAPAADAPAGDSPEGVHGPAEVHAPIGICTGDYSKFPELRRLLHMGTQPEKQELPGKTDGTTALPPGSNGPPAAAAPVTALKGVITVSQLRTVRGAVRLAKGAILTPLAQDFIRERHVQVMSDEMAPAVKVNGGSAPLAGSAPVMWWIEGQCPSVAKLVDALRQNLLASRERGSAENLKSVVKELALLVKNKKVAGGVLFVPSAARAVCYANRCQSLRAVVATNDRAVSEGIELLGANVLVVEYPPFGFKAMLALVKPFVESMQQVPAAVQRELDELRNCS